MENHDEARSEMQGLIQFEKHEGYDTGDRMEKAIEEGTVVEEEVAKVFIDGKNTVPMDDIDEFKGHRGRALHGIKIAASGAEAAMTAKRDKFEFTALGAAIHGAAKGRVTTGDHLIDIFHHRRSGMKSV